MTGARSERCCLLSQEHTISQQLLETTCGSHADEIAALQTEAAGLKQVPPVSTLYRSLLPSATSTSTSICTYTETLINTPFIALSTPPQQPPPACSQRVDASKAAQGGLQRELEAALEAQQLTHAQVQDRTSEIEQAQVRPPLHECRLHRSSEYASQAVLCLHAD